MKVVVPESTEPFVTTLYLAPQGSVMRTVEFPGDFLLRTSHGFVNLESGDLSTEVGPRSSAGAWKVIIYPDAELHPGAPKVA
jgi:hypothetical protein